MSFTSDRDRNIKVYRDTGISVTELIAVQSECKDSAV